MVVAVVDNLVAAVGIPVVAGADILVAAGGILVAELILLV